MKFKLKKSKASSGRQLVVKPVMRDDLVYSQIELLRQGNAHSFLPFRTLETRRGLVIVYELGKCISVKEMAKRLIDRECVCSLLLSIQTMLSESETLGIKRQRIAFDAEKVFYSEEKQTFEFVYLPLQSFTALGSETSLLIDFCERVRTSDQAEPLCAATLAFARKTPIITRKAFDAFLSENAVGPTNSKTSRFGMTIPVAAERAGARMDGRRVPASRHSAQGSELWILSRPDSGERHTFGFGEYSIGRDSGCSLCLADDQGVSRRHAKLLVSYDGCYITDLDSTNGTLVNDTFIVPNTPMSLKSGDIVALGTTEYVIVRQDEG